MTEPNANRWSTTLQQLGQVSTRAPVQAPTFNPRPRGAFQRGSTGALLMFAMYSRRGTWLGLYELREMLRRSGCEVSPGTVRWYLLALRQAGYLRVASDERNTRYLRYSAHLPSDEPDTAKSIADV